MKIPDHAVVLSPHLDDAVLSAGAVIAAWRRMGRSVTILTIFSGAPVGELSDAARAEFAHYDGEFPLPFRLLEDDAAAGILEVDIRRADLPEVLFRRRRNGAPRCEVLSDIFGPLQPGDEADIAAVAEVLKNIEGELIVPLAIGGHVDHVITRRAAESLNVPLTYYQDIPYLLRGEAAEWPDNGVGWPWEVEDKDIEKWLDSAGCYKSQIRILFESIDWRSDLRQHARNAFLVESNGADSKSVRQ